MQRLCIIFLLASPTSTSWTVTGRRVHQDTRVHDLSQSGWTTATWYSLVHRGLSLRDCTERVLNAAARLVSGTRKYTTVDCRSCYIPTRTGCGRSSPIQACHHIPPASAHQNAKVPDRLLCRCLAYRWSSETALSTPSPAGCTALSTNNTQPSGVLCRWTNRLEFASSRAKRMMTLTESPKTLLFRQY